MKDTPETIKSENQREVIILGCGPTHVECKYHCETWGVNGTYTFARRLDKLFFTDEESEVNSCWYDLPELLTLNPTVVFPVEYKRFKNLGLNIELFPINEIMQRFPTTFYSNTIAYMLAMAVYKRFDTIHMFGIDMMSNSTYIQEKGGVEYWMGVALGQGIQVLNTSGSATGKTWNGRMYGHYGAVEEQVAKEGLFAPWELIRVNTAAKPGTDWIKIGEEYVPVKTEVKVAGN